VRPGGPFGFASTREEDMLVESNPNGPPDTQRLSAPSGKPDGAHGAIIPRRIPPSRSLPVVRGRCLSRSARL